MRIIPLPPVRERQGVTAVYPLLTPRSKSSSISSAGASSRKRRQLFSTLSATTATMSAYYVYLQTIADWLVRQGWDRIDADRIVRGQFAGLGNNLSTTDSSFSPLSSPGTRLQADSTKCFTASGWTSITLPRCHLSRPRLRASDRPKDCRGLPAALSCHTRPSAHRWNGREDRLGPHVWVRALIRKITSPAPYSPSQSRSLGSMRGCRRDSTRRRKRDGYLDRDR